MSYQTLTHPETHKTVSIYSLEGRALLKQYVRAYIQSAYSRHSGGFSLKNLELHEGTQTPLKMYWHQLHYWVTNTNRVSRYGKRDVIKASRSEFGDVFGDILFFPIKATEAALKNNKIHQEHVRFYQSKRFYFGNKTNTWGIQAVIPITNKVKRPGIFASKQQKEEYDDLFRQTEADADIAYVIRVPFPLPNDLSASIDKPTIPSDEPLTPELVTQYIRYKWHEIEESSGKYYYIFRSKDTSEHYNNTFFYYTLLSESYALHNDLLKTPLTNPWTTSVGPVSLPTTTDDLEFTSYEDTETNIQMMAGWLSEKYMTRNKLPDKIRNDTEQYANQQENEQHTKKIILFNIRSALQNKFGKYYKFH